MTGHADGGHIDDERLAALALDELQEDELRAVLEHLADCDLCAEAAREARAVALETDGWTARAHGEAIRAADAVAGVRDAARSAPSEAVGERLGRWVERWAGKASAAIRVVVSASDRVRLEVEGLEGLVAPGGLGRFALATPVAAPARSHAPDGVRGRGVRKRGGAPHTGAATSASTPGSTPCRVTARRGALEIELLGWSAAEPPPLVVLASGGQPRRARTLQLERQPGTDAVVGRFDHLEPGEYLMLVEPTT